MKPIVWHRMMKEAGRAVLSGRKHPTPLKGVWVANLQPNTNEFQKTEEAVAVNGTIVWRKECWCGYDRHLAWKVAEDYLFGRRS